MIGLSFSHCLISHLMQKLGAGWVGDKVRAMGSSASVWVDQVVRSHQVANSWGGCGRGMPICLEARQLPLPSIGLGLGRLGRWSTLAGTMHSCSSHWQAEQHSHPQRTSCQSGHHWCLWWCQGARDKRGWATCPTSLALWCTGLQPPHILLREAPGPPDFLSGQVQLCSPRHMSEQVDETQTEKAKGMLGSSVQHTNKYKT